MNWESILTEVIISVVGLVFSGLGALLAYWISKNIKNEKLKGYALSLADLVKTATLETYQTYVEGLKEGGMFDEEAQKTALRRALTSIRGNMSNDLKEWLETNFKDVEGHLKSLVEAQIASLKNGGK